MAADLVYTAGSVTVFPKFGKILKVTPTAEDLLELYFLAHQSHMRKTFTMTQFSAMLSTSTSLVENYTSEAVPATILWVLAAFVALIGIPVFVARSKSLQKWFPWSLIAAVFFFVAFFVVGGNIGGDAVHRTDEATQRNISQQIKDKYGVTVLNESDTISPLKETSVFYHKVETNRGVISATNAAGERIQVTIELVDNNTDVLAFSSGTEMKKVSK